MSDCVEIYCDNCVCSLLLDKDFVFYDTLPYETMRLPIGKSGIVCFNCDFALSMFSIVTSL